MTCLQLQAMLAFRSFHKGHLNYFLLTVLTNFSLCEAKLWEEQYFAALGVSLTDLVLASLRQDCRTRRMFVARLQSCPAKTMAPKSLESCWMQARGTEGPFLSRSREVLDSES